MFYKSAHPNEPAAVPGSSISLEFSPFNDWFGVEDGEHLLDVRESFASRRILSIALKVLATMYTTFAFVYSLVLTNNWDLYFGSLTGFSLAGSVACLWVSLASSIMGVEQPQRLQKVPTITRVEWVLFTFASHISILSASLWWVTVYDEHVTLTLENVSVHGGTLFAVLCEGFIVNRIPIRWYYWWWTGLPVPLVFIGFTYLFTGLSIGSPDDAESDLIYEYFDWKNDAMWAGVRSAIVVLGISPFVQLLIFGLSLFGRKYVDEHAHRTTETSKTQEPIPATSVQETSSDEGV